MELRAQGLQAPHDVLRVVLEVRVDGRDERPSGVREAGEERRGLASSSRLGDDANPGVLGSRLEHLGARAVLRRVVDQDYLVVTADEGLPYRLGEEQDVALLIVGGNHDGNFGSRRVIGLGRGRCHGRDGVLRKSQRAGPDYS